jgi:hypothetical protein
VRRAVAVNRQRCVRPPQPQQLGADEMGVDQARARKLRVRSVAAA